MKYIQFNMSKNLQKDGSRGLIPEKERIRPNINIAVGDRLHHATHSHYPYSPKASKQLHTSAKHQTIPRYASEEEFKKFNVSTSQLHANSEADDLYGSGGGYSVNSEHFVRKLKSSTQSKEEGILTKKASGLSGKGAVSEKGLTSSQEVSNNFINQLKETTSTTSADYQSVQYKKPPPAFLKSKSRNNFIPSKVPSSSSQGARFSIENFKILKKLGEGKFGKVYLVKQLITGFILAMKVIDKKKVIEDNLLEQFTRELKIQTFLNHPNIIKVFGFFHSERHFYTLLELGSDGQLYNLISSRKKITEEAASFISKNLLEAIECMHDNKILHRDIKPENIVLIMGNVKICDFGWAANKVTKEELRSTYCGTPLYLSPEILKGNRYDEKVDIWAIGILAYELLLGNSPFEIYEQNDLHKIMTDEVTFPAHKKVSNQFQVFINSILNKDPKERLASTQLLQLPFIKKYEGFETCEQLCS